MNIAEFLLPGMDKSSFEEQIKKALEFQEPSTDLLPKIIFAIARRRRTYARLKFGGFSLLSAASLSLMFFAFGELGRQINQAGTLKFLSLIFSDLEIVLANWQEFSLSFLESLPILPITLSLAGILSLLFAVKFMFVSLPKINPHLAIKNIGH